MKYHDKFRSGSLEQAQKSRFSEITRLGQLTTANAKTSKIIQKT
jgi:hypothetical protein